MNYNRFLYEADFSLFISLVRASYPDSFWKLEEDGNENKIFDNGWYKAVKKSIDFRPKDQDLKSDPGTQNEQLNKSKRDEYFWGTQCNLKYNLM